MINIDFQFIANIIVTVAFGIVGYFYNKVSTDLDKNRQMINDVRIDLPKNYVSRDDLSSHLTRIETMLNKIFDRLEQKADK